MSKSREFNKQGSVFRAYSIPANTYQDVRDFYRKLKLVQPSSRHIPCAYQLPTTGPFYESSDFHDDGEPGSGRVLLNFLHTRNIQNTALFVVRKYGGVKLGADRFTMYEHAAKSILDPDDELLRQWQQEQQSSNQTARDVSRDSFQNRSYQPRSRGRASYTRGTWRGRTYRPAYDTRTSNYHGDYTTRQRNQQQSRGQPPIRQARPSTQRSQYRQTDENRRRYGSVTYQDVLDQQSFHWNTQG